MQLERITGPVSVRRGGKESTGGIILATPQATTSGDTKTFSGLRAELKQIVVMFNGVSVTGSTDIRVRIGPVGGREISGYISNGAQIFNGANPAILSSSTSFMINLSSSSDTLYGELFLNLLNASTNTWVSSHTLRSQAQRVVVGGGVKSISGELFVVEISVTPTGDFDAGQLGLQSQ